jgi:hypothetical protein
MPVTIEMSVDTPKIVLDEDNSIFLIEGHSYPADAFKAYKVVLEWVKDIYSDTGSQLICEFKFKMISSASRKMIYEIMKELEIKGSENKNIQIHWYYESYDDDMIDVGEYFAECISLPFKFISM